MGLNVQITSILTAFLFLLARAAYGQELLTETKLDSISVFFETGSFTVKKPAVLLNRINALPKQGLGRVVLLSYTDSIGNLSSNQLLASKRLQSVHKILLDSNLKDFILDSLNQNEKRDNTNLADTKYRRVDILIYQIKTNYTLNKAINLNIQFLAGSDHVDPVSVPILKKLVYVMKLDDSLKIHLNGHVCCQADQAMSLKRAKRVKIFLVKNGIDAQRIDCFGYSNTVKLVEETTPQNQAINRRVEVVFLK